MAGPRLLQVSDSAADVAFEGVAFADGDVDQNWQAEAASQRRRSLQRPGVG